MTTSENPEIQVASTPGSTTESGDHPNLLEAEPYIDRRYFFVGLVFHCFLHSSHLGISIQVLVSQKIFLPVQS